MRVPIKHRSGGNHRALEAYLLFWTPGLSSQDRGPTAARGQHLSKTSLFHVLFLQPPSHVLTDELILQMLNTLHPLALLSTTLSTSFPTALWGEARSSAPSCCTPAVGCREISAPREVLANARAKRRNLQSRAGSLSPSRDPPDALEAHHSFWHPGWKDISPHPTT